MRGKLAPARERFAQIGARMEQEILKNPEFRSLCEDYGDAVEALQHWESGEDPLSQQKVLEYRELVEDLEEEIRDHLGSLSPG